LGIEKWAVVGLTDAAKGSGFTRDLHKLRGEQMETRIAVIAIIIEDLESSEALNQLLHEYNGHIIGRMGVPYRQKKVSIMSVMLDAPQNTISALSGKIGMLPGVSSKTLYSKVES